MNGLRHIVLLLGIGVLLADPTPPEQFTYNQSQSQEFYYFYSVTINDEAVDSIDWVGAFN